MKRSSEAGTIEIFNICQWAGTSLSWAVELSTREVGVRHDLHKGTRDGLRGTPSITNYSVNNNAVN